MNPIDMPLPTPAMPWPKQLSQPPQRNGAATLPQAMTAGQRRIHRSLCLLVISLIFEGIARKLAPGFLGTPIFFFKDFLTLWLLFICLKEKRNPVAAHWLNVMGVWSALLAPCILLTATNSPILAVFGAKQYLLFPAVAVAMGIAYLPNHRQQLYSLFRLIAWSVVVTTLVSVAQNRLPASNWLNLSVAGTDLSNFSAGGYLRVSSTFPFVGQYCYYLNALCYCLPVYFFLNDSLRGWTVKLQALVFIGLFLVGTFVTGSRTSVVGSAGILCASGLLLAVCGGPKAVLKILIPVGVGIALLGLIQTVYPEFFAAYNSRTSEASHNAELAERIQHGLLGWTDGWENAPPSLLGYGLGVMSNGSDKLSAYAAQWRASGFWTETDQATTFFEGGWYLVLVWYGFRFWIVFRTLTLVLRLRRMDFRIAACFAWGFIAIIGLTGTLALQPQEAIWWWLAVGFIPCLSGFDRMHILAGHPQPVL